MRQRLLTIFALLVLPVMLTGAAEAPVTTPAEHTRPPDQTFLTYPEWYLVFSPAEYADYTRTNYASGFPFVGHIGQFWQSYGAVYREIKDRFAFNTGYHVMIMVIGVSTTVEYGFRAAYEKVFGRLSAFTAGGEFTAEDRLAAAVAQDYIEFISTAPWYEYDFSTQLKRVWTDTGFFGDNLLRKWERKYALTTEYALKAGYGWLIKKGTRASFEVPLLETLVVAERVPANVAQTFADVSVVEDLGADRLLLALPRYAPFTARARSLALAGVDFHEVAGNTGDILLSIVTAREEAWPAGTRVLFEQPVMTRPGDRRVGLVVPVTALASTLRQLDRQGATVEHVFDY